MPSVALATNCMQACTYSWRRGSAYLSSHTNKFSQSLLDPACTRARYPMLLLATLLPFPGARSSKRENLQFSQPCPCPFRKESFHPCPLPSG